MSREEIVKELKHLEHIIESNGQNHHNHHNCIKRLEYLKSKLNGTQNTLPRRSNALFSAGA